MTTLIFTHRRLILATMTALFYGVLAYLANHDQGQHAALKAALVQAGTSTLMVVFSSMMMEFFFKWGTTIIAKYCYAFFLSGFIVFSINLVAHWLGGTPNLLLTLLYGFLTALPYYLVYPYLLARHYLSAQPTTQLCHSHEKP